jgi:AP-3 complex subunit mu
VYLLLDEMIDSGFPFNTELNTLESIIAPATTLTKVVSAVAGSSASVLSDVAPDPKGQNTALVGIAAAIGVAQSTTLGGASAEVWWRRQNVQYASNEIYVDIVERIDCIFDGGFHMIAGGVMGEIQVNSKLSGMPEVSLSLKNPSVLQNASFHPCVRLHRFQRDNVLSFIPPDGEFTLVSYWIPDTTLSLPFVIGGELKYHDDVGKMQFTAAPKLSIMHANNQMFIDKFCINVRLPGSIATGTLMTNSGSVRFDEETKVAIWNIGKLQGQENKVDGTLTYSTDKDGQNVIPSEEKSTAQLAFIVKGWSISGIRLDSCEVTGVQYSPYKACRYTTTSGKMEFRIP